MSTPADRTDPIDSVEADAADVLEQAQPLTSEPVEDALRSSAAIPDVDPELTGIEAEEAEDSGQA
jgi:hypothetical protein